jgi:glycosyltransferase involved in cell wall biosynthesis
MAENTIRYADITPTKNEERSIAQGRPIAWVLVDDASTDGISHIVKDYATRCPWIYYLLYPGEAGSNSIAG